MSSTTPDRPRDTAHWDWAKSQFELDPDYVHLALSMLAPHPRPVRAAIEHHRRSLDRNPALHFHERDDRVRQVLDSAAAYLGGRPDSIALTESTTAGLAVVCAGIRLAPGDEILSTDHEHYAASEILRFKAAASGATHRVIPLYGHAPEADTDEMVDAVVRGIGPRTRLLVLTWVHSGTGVKLPLEAIGAAVTALNADRPAEQQLVLCVDAVHALGVEDFDVTELGCDFFVAGCHKWLFGPRGTGVVWGSDRGGLASHPSPPPSTSRCSGPGTSAAPPTVRPRPLGCAHPAASPPTNTDGPYTKRFGSNWLWDPARSRHG